MAGNQDTYYSSTDFDWSAYLASRPQYPQSLYNTIFEHHQKYSNKWNHAYDMGTGVGVVAWELASRFEQITASDPSSHHLSAARAKQPNIQFLQCRAEDVSQLQANSIDLITIAEAIHYTDSSRTIASAAHLLFPGGTFATWAYDIVPRINTGPDAESNEIQTQIYRVFDPWLAALESKVRPTDPNTIRPGVKLWSDMIDLRFDRKEWTHIRRLHWKRHREFGEYVATQIDQSPVMNCQQPWERVEEQEESCMIVRDADMGWIRAYLDSLYPGLIMSEACPEEIAALETMMQNGRKVDLAFTTSLVLATKR